MSNRSSSEDANFTSGYTLTKVKDLIQFHRSYSEHVDVLQGAFDVRIAGKGRDLLISGRRKDVFAALDLLKGLEFMASEGYRLSREEYAMAVRNAQNGDKSDFRSLLLSSSVLITKNKRIYPKTPNQKDFILAVQEHDLVFAIGPAGTGKTYLAVALAVTYLLTKKINRIILARPAVEAGESLGFLPGDMYQKVNPYFRPLYDALFEMLDLDRTNRLIERGVIELAPLAYMRGRTLNDSFIIMDEAQNTTPEQMKMFLTRLGFNAKAIVTGDITQIDLPPSKKSGLIEVQHILKGIPSIKFNYFTDKDVVRCGLVQDIVKAYEANERRIREKSQEGKGTSLEQNREKTKKLV